MPLILCPEWIFINNDSVKEESKQLLDSVNVSLLRLIFYGYWKLELLENWFWQSLIFEVQFINFWKTEKKNIMRWVKKYDEEAS